MDQMTAMITRMKKIVDRSLVQTISINAKIQSASLKLMFVMEKMIVETIRMNHMNMLVLHHHLDVQSVNGSVLASRHDVSI